MTVTSEFFMPPPAGARDAVTEWADRLLEKANEVRALGIKYGLNSHHEVAELLIELRREALTGKADVTQPAAPGAGEDRVSLTHDELQAIKDAAYRDGYERRHLEVLGALA